MKNLKLKVRLLGLLFVLILALASSIFALGVTPGTTLLDFEPDGIKDARFTVVNSDAVPVSLVFEVSGSLADHIELLTPEAIIAPGSSTFVDFRIMLPSDLKQIDSARIVIKERKKSIVREGISIKPFVAVTHNVVIVKPFQDVRLEKTWAARDVFEEQVTFFARLKNYGTAQRSGGIEVFLSKENKQPIELLSEEGVNLVAGEQKDVGLKWSTIGLQQGVYYVKTKSSFGGNIEQKERVFNLVDEEEVFFGEVRFSDFKLGDLVEVSVDVKNNLRHSIEQASAKIIVLDERGRQVAELEVEELSLGIGEKTVLTAFWNTKGIGVGKYDLKVVLEYGAGYSEKSVKAQVSKNKITGQGIRTIKESRSLKELLRYTLVLSTLIIIIIIQIILKRREKNRW